MLILNSDELESKLHAALEGLSETEREEWLRHPLTEVMGILFETIRMKSLEAMEAGLPAEIYHKISGQASIMRDMRENLRATIKQSEEENDDNSSSGA